MLYKIAVMLYLARICCRNCEKSRKPCQVTRSPMCGTSQNEGEFGPLDQDVSCDSLNGKLAPASSSLSRNIFCTFRKRKLTVVLTLGNSVRI